MSFRRRLAGLKSLAIVTLITVGLTEIVVRIYSRVHTSYDIEMSRYALEVKQEDPNPALGHVHRPDARARLMNVEIATNHDGLRDRDYPIERTAARRQIFLGDSITLGWGVAADQTFESILERDLSSVRPTEILNFGIGNYNTAQEVALFREKGLKYRPDGVVVFAFINDAEPTPHRSRDWLASSRALTFFWSKIKTIRSRTNSNLSWRQYYANLYQDGQPGWVAQKAAFLELQRLCAERSIALRVVLIPELHQLDPYAFEKEHALLIHFLSENGIASLDVTPAFRGDHDPSHLWVAPDDAHPNAAAHAIIAGYARAFVETEPGAHSALH